MKDITIVFVSMLNNIITTEAIKNVNKAPNNNGPKRSKFIFVLVPITIKLPKYTKLTKKAMEIEPRSYANAKVESVIPSNAAYVKNNILAVTVDNLWSLAPNHKLHN